MFIGLIGFHIANEIIFSWNFFGNTAFLTLALVPLVLGMPAPSLIEKNDNKKDFSSGYSTGESHLEQA